MTDTAAADNGAPARYDVLIAGGGLAGLTLALQLRRRFPDLSILVLERKPHPLPLAAHKVGESTVEIGAHYLAQTCGLRAHLEGEHIRKFGFRFFFSEGRRDLDQLTELGVRRVLPTPSYQIDRGILENFLGQEVQRQGIGFQDRAVVRRIELGSGAADHVIAWERDGVTRQASARWLVDASGRAGLLKRQLGLQQANEHDANAVWFRIDARLPIDDWCANPAWRGQCVPPERWRSTNHLVGPGYWVWLIPLASGAHSVGIVCDAKMHPLATMNTFERALDWLRRYQPLVAEHVEAQRERLLDFAFFRKFSYGCKQVFGERWALTGEAGLFLDPFYSPGSDFIGIANTYITELIGHDRAGTPVLPYARIYEQLYFSFYQSTLALYQDQYPLFGNAEVLPIKVIWDYAYYWGVLCQLVFQQRLADLRLLGELRPELELAQRLNLNLQALFRAWHAARPAANPATMLDQGGLDWFHEMNRTLHDELDDAGVRVRLRSNVVLLQRLAGAIVRRSGLDLAVADALHEGHPELFDSAAPARLEIAA